MALTRDSQSFRSRLQIGLLITAAVLIGVSLLGFSTGNINDQRQRDWREQVRLIGEDALAIATQAEGTARGVAPDFLSMVSGIEDLEIALDGLANGDALIDLKPLPSSVAPQLNATRAAADELTATIYAVLEGEAPYTELVRERAIATETLDTVAFDAALIAERSVRSNVATAVAAGEQWALTERVRAILPRVTGDGRNAAALGAALATDWAALGAVQSTLLNVAEPQGAIRSAIDALQASIDSIVGASSAVGELQINAAVSQGQAAEVLANVRALEQALINVIPQNNWMPVASGIALLIALAAIGAFVALFFTGLQKQTTQASNREAQQQQAILGLLDEITNLADGDLTVDVTVTEDFTGAIADSLNYTVQNMRELVGTINSTSAQVAAGANATQDLAQRMSAGSERQASDIAALTQQMAATATALTGVAERAESVAEQAEESVDVARGGAETAHGTINVMTALREQIQDTSKRIKRLGESSQEIGNIIELINDIAEQTGTLALNAAIQAAMAGEQGRGFAVVAEEVQRLAERASTATRQVETLVKTIQADTNEAIVSMERSTHNVVTGARSAEEAGGALSRVQLSSQTMADLIASIAGEARGQSASTTDAAKRMQGIREISTQTSRSSADTAKAVAELSSLSSQLRQSVAGFKLPE